MRLLLAPYLIPMLIFLPMALIILCKSFFLTKSSLSYLGSQMHLIAQLLFQASEFCFFACIHFWIYYLFKKHLHLTSIFLNIYFITFYFLLFALVLYDYQNGNFNEQEVLFSLMKAYLPLFSTHPKFSFPLDMVPRNNYNSMSFVTDIIFAIVDEPVFWVIFLSFFSIFFAYCIFLIIKFKLEICFSIKQEDLDNDIKCDYSSLIEQKFKIDVSDSIDFDSKYFKIFHILGVLYLVSAISYTYTPVRQRIADITKFNTNYNIFYSFNHYEKKLNKDVDMLNISRRFLPEGRYWLDNRNPPIYPLVHGDINAFCAYNNNDPKCKPEKSPQNSIITKKHTKLEKMPNVYFLIVESFNPFSYLINDDF